MAEYAHLSSPDPELIPILAQLPPTPSLDISQRRKIAEDRAAKVSFPETQLKVQDWKVPVQGGEIQVRTYVPQQGKGESNPLFVWAHGGGWITGGLFTDDAMLQKLAIDLGLSIVNVDYRLAPEHPFPAGLNDTYDALKWAYHNSHQLDADPAKGFILGGFSTGANFTAVLTHRAREDPELRGKLTGHILQLPAVVNKDAIPEAYKKDILSYEQNKDAPVLDQTSIKFFLEQYGCNNPSDPEISPLYWASHKDLPPAYFQICGLDPLRDEAFLYEKLLQEEGIKTKHDVYPGLPHAFSYFFPKLSQCAKWEEDLKQGVKWLLTE